MPRWQAVVFDLDDTLYPERDFVLSGFRAVARWAAAQFEISPEHVFSELVSLFEQGVRGNTFNRWLTDRHFPADTYVNQMVTVYREHDPVLVPFPEVENLLKTLRPCTKLGLVSDGFRDVQQRKLTALGLAPLFHVVVFSDEWGREAWKPSQTPFLAVLSRLEVDAANTVYIGDNPLKDFKGAREVGITTVWLRRPEGEYSHLNPPNPEYAPDQVFASFAELANWLVQEQDKDQ